ncbi:MAG: PilN domain-containing protein [Deltaproteobacteria bacterium]|nr:PilN domain-containing protein [Deltaproteobacteria bacterium]MCW5809042.1 PilN domain-containing protein [Deltaproteobacteria bacterium]
MIKINLLPQKRPKQRAGAGGPRTAGEASSSGMMFGVVGLAAAAAAVFFLIDKPKRDAIAESHEIADKANQDAAKARAQLSGGSNELSYADLQKAEADATQREQSIARLMGAKVVPAHVLHELGKILTPKGIPTMTAAMSARAGATMDPKQLQDWEPTQVWLTSFSDQAGSFKLEGGAQTEAVVDQLRERLAASVHFIDVTPAGGERVTDRETNLNYFRFTITGKLAY